MAGGNLTRSVDPTGGQSAVQLLGSDVNNLIAAYNAGKIDFNNFNTPLIIPDANGIPNVLLGPRQVNNQRGLFIAKPGISVITATDDQLIFNSLQNVLKIVSTNTVTIPQFTVASSASGNQTQTVNHNLGFLPVALPYALDTSGGQYFFWQGKDIVPIVGATITIGALIEYDTFIDTTTIEFLVAVTNRTGGTYTLGPFNIRYYLLQETAN